MNTYSNNLSPETSLLVEALQAMIEAEDKALTAYMERYGYGFNKGEGDYMFQLSGVCGIFVEAKRALKERIGDSVEEDLDRLSVEENKQNKQIKKKD